MEVKCYRITDEGKESEDARMDILLFEASEDSTIRFFSVREVTDIGLKPRDLTNLCSEGLLELIDTPKNNNNPTLEDYAYEKEVELRLQEATEELKALVAAGKDPTIEVFRRYRSAHKEFMRLAGASLIF